MGDLNAFLTDWLGAAPNGCELKVVASDRRTEPGWDGRVHRIVGVSSPSGTVLSVPPDQEVDIRALSLVEYVLRSTRAPAPLEDVGVWMSPEDPALPEWLRPFGPEVLAVLIDGEYVAGAGIKRHTPSGHEIAVGTAEAWWGRGYARRLVAQAARAVLATGAIATYAHAPDNLASARVAEAAGFADNGFRLLALKARDPGDAFNDARVVDAERREPAWGEMS